MSDQAAVAARFAATREDMGEVGTLFCNAGTGVFADVEHVTADQFEAARRVNALGLFPCSREVIPAMKAAGDGGIAVIGATASRRGGKATAAFAPAEAAQRGPAEPMARRLWPAGIRVAVIVVDGAVNRPGTRERMPDKPDDFFVGPAGVAQIAWNATAALAGRDHARGDHARRPVGGRRSRPARDPPPHPVWRARNGPGRRSPGVSAPRRAERAGPGPGTARSWRGTGCGEEDRPGGLSAAATVPIWAGWTTT